MEIIIEEALKKLNKESDETPAAKVFTEYLKVKIKSDLNLAQNIIKPDKTIIGMLDYIKDNAQKKAVSGFACVEGSTVFKWTENYFGVDKPEVKESDIEAAAHSISTGAATTIISDKPKKPKKETINEPDNQISLLDMLGVEL